MKGKENKVVDDLSRKFHMAAINMYQMDLKAKILEVAANEWFILQLKEGFLLIPVKGKYEGIKVDEDGLLLYKGCL